jgi:hypothetical protein
MSESKPIHVYSDFANTVHQWMPMDTLDRWQANCADVKQRQQLIEHGWLPEQAITYRLNSHGFRSPEFNDVPSILCLGCSHTMGIGLPLEQTWPYILEQKSGVTCWNLGLGGAGLDTVYRMAEHYAHHLNVIAVVCLVPDPARLELFIKGKPVIFNWLDEQHHSFLQAWLADDENAQVNSRKNLKAIEKICDDAGAPFVYFENFLKKIPTHSKARDLTHVGYAVQNAIADRFLTMLLPIMHK